MDCYCTKRSVAASAQANCMPEIKKSAFEIKHHAKFVFLGTFDELRFN